MPLIASRNAMRGSVLQLCSEGFRNVLLIVTANKKFPFSSLIGIIGNKIGTLFPYPFLFCSWYAASSWKKKAFRVGPSAGRHKVVRLDFQSMVSKQ